jgi:hypothetical protein
MNKKKLLAKIYLDRRNVRYDDFIQLVLAFGFVRVRNSGSHEIYRCGSVPEFLCIQNFHGEAKAYQIGQFLSLVEKYNLEMEG